MKKGLVIKTPLLLVIGGLVVVMVFFVMYGGSGLITEGFSQIPSFINETMDQISRRSPSANSAYFISELYNAFSFSKETSSTDKNCFFRLDSGKRRMVNGYISLEEVGNEIEFYLNPQNPEDLNGDDENDEEYEIQKHRHEGDLCLIYGGIADELQEELNKHNVWRRSANKALNWLPYVNDLGYIELERDYYSIDELNILIGSDGIEEITIEGNPFKISEYMVYVDGEVCFIPLSSLRQNIDDCGFQNDGAMNLACNNLFGRSRFSCHG